MLLFYYSLNIIIFPFLPLIVCPISIFLNSFSLWFNPYWSILSFILSLLPLSFPIACFLGLILTKLCCTSWVNSLYIIFLLFYFFKFSDVYFSYHYLAHVLSPLVSRCTLCVCPAWILHFQELFIFALLLKQPDYTIWKKNHVKSIIIILPVSFPELIPASYTVNYSADYVDYVRYLPYITVFAFQFY